MKKFLLYSTLSISVLLTSQCIAYQPNLTEKHSESTKASWSAASDSTEKREIVLWQEFTIYSLIAAIYAGYWLRRKI